MVEILHTRDMEATVRTLAARYERVLVRNKHVLFHPVRLKRAALADLKPHIVRSPPQFDGELHAWNREGGVLIYDRGYKRDEEIAPHHAQFITECPLSVEWIERVTAGTREVAVIYLPPHWREHERGVRTLFPDADLCERVYRAMRAAPRASADAREAIGTTGEGTLLSDQALAAALKITPGQVKRIRNTMLLKSEWKPVNPVVLRIEPEEDPVLVKVYQAIQRDCPVLDGAHMIVGTGLNRVTRFWSMALRSLERRGNIAWRDTLFFYRLDGLEPDWAKIQRTHEEAKENMRRAAAYVAATPEFSLQVEPSSRSPARRAPSRQSSAA